jgi:hypothetical protein
MPFYLCFILIVCALMGMALSASITTSTIGQKIFGIACNSLIVACGIFHCFSYLKKYVDYRFQELEKVNQKRENAS